MFWQPWKQAQAKLYFFILLLLVICAISQDPSLVLRGTTFPEDPQLRIENSDSPSSHTVQ